MAAPRLTVITVVKNDLDGLKKTYESLRRQRDQAFRWLVADGQSSDGSLPWLAALEHPRPDVTSQRDRSVFHAMNTALDRVTTDYCLFLNAGDTFASEDVTARIAAAIRDRPFDVAHGQYVIEAAPGFPARVRGQPIASRLALFRGPVPCHQTMVISRRAFAENGRYREDVGIYGDAEWILRYAGKRPLSELVFMPFVVASYAAGGLSHRRFFASRGAWLGVLREHGSAAEVAAGLLGWAKTAAYVTLSAAAARWGRRAGRPSDP